MLSWHIGLFAALLGADELAKQHVEENIEAGETREFFGGKILLRKVYNRGFMMNTLERYPAVIKGTSVVAGLGVLFCDVLLFLKKGHFVEKLGMTFLSAGAAGNIFDRLARGKVIDYIGIRTKNRRLSRITANLSDLWIALGAVITTLGGFPEMR